MQKITPLKSRVNAAKRKTFNLLSLGVTIAVVCLGLQGFKPEKFPASAKEVASTNTWQYASFPVENFQAYTSGYGYRISPYDGQIQFHQGLDMAAPLGSYVRNWWAGKVVDLSDDTACGTLITIQSGGWKHTYCHLSGHVETTPKGRYLIDPQGGIQLWENQQIPAGARIARVGMTGRTTGPHLHWGLKYNGNYVDPALVLREMHKQQKLSRSNARNS